MTDNSFLEEFDLQDAELLALAKETRLPKRRAEIANILMGVRGIKQFLIDDVDDIGDTLLIQTIVEIRERISRLKADPNSAGKHDQF